MAKENSKNSTDLKSNEVKIFSKNENKELTVDKEDFQKESDYFHSTGNITWDWEIVS